MTTRYLDLEGGNNSNDGSTFALRKKTLASACSGLAGGDTVRVMASKDPTSTGQNATFTNSSDVITLTTAVTANISTCETAWTPSANVTATAQTTYLREGTNAARNDIASAFTTGLVAYTAFSATDFSAYQQISFLFYSGTAFAAGVLQLKLCSDAAGATPVNSVDLPAIPAGHWTAVCVDTGGALGASIQSVALYAASDPGAINTVIDNIIACKASSAADSLTHYSLIGKNTGTEPWMAIDTINGTTIKLAGGYQSTASRTGMQPYYYGATATQTLYKREPIVVGATAVPGGGNSSASLLSVECGWDRTAMSAQSGQTFVRALDPSLATGLYDGNIASYGYLNKWYSVNSVNAGIIGNRSWSYGEIGAIACGAGIVSYQATDIQAVSSATRYAVQCGNGVKFLGAGLGNGTDARLRFNYLWGYSNSNFACPAINDSSNSPGFGRIHVYGADIQGHYCYSGSSSIVRGGFAEIVFQNCTIRNMNRDTAGGPDKVFLTNCTLSSITNLVVPTSGALYFTNQAGDTTSHKIVFGSAAGQGSIASDTSTRNTASDFAWKFTTTSSGGGTLAPALSMSVAKIACVANEQRTVTAYLRRDSASLTVRLRVKGGYVSGVDDDVNAACSAAINTWQQVTLQFTPTQQCVVEVFAEAWGANAANGWIDDLGVS